MGEEHEHGRPAYARLSVPVTYQKGDVRMCSFIDAENSALGRSPLLSSQSDQPVASFVECDELHSHVFFAVLGSGDSSDDRVDAVDDQPPDRPFLSSSRKVMTL